MYLQNFTEKPQTDYKNYYENLRKAAFSQIHTRKSRENLSPLIRSTESFPLSKNSSQKKFLRSKMRTQSSMGNIGQISKARLWNSNEHAMKQVMMAQYYKDINERLKNNSFGPPPIIPAPQVVIKGTNKIKFSEKSNRNYQSFAQSRPTCRGRG
jgi:hypothetical protein